MTSAKTGEGIRAVLEAVVKRIPAPQGDADAPLQALIFDSYFDEYRGVVALIRVMNGSVRKGDNILMLATTTVTGVEEVGVRRPANIPVDSLNPGEVGYLITGLKDPSLVKVGDTITLQHEQHAAALPGYREVKPMVYAGSIHPRRAKRSDSDSASDS